MDLKNLTIQNVHEGLQNKTFSCLELTQAYLRWIDQRNKEVNSFITVTKDLAVKQAKAVDKKIASGDTLRLLEGVPCAIKDNILVEDVLATGGSKILSNYKAVYNASVVEKLKTEGVVILGKTNMDEFAMGGSGENSGYGVTKNPLDFEKVPGGSSSGSAAAVADNQCVFALGSDTGGSIRQPASFCGLVGIKPTYGLVSRHGLMAMASSFDQIGCLTRTVEDASEVLSYIAGQDQLDSTSVKHDLDFVADLNNSVKGLTIGIPKEFFTKGIDPEVERAVLQAINVLRDLGAKAVEVSLPHTKYALSTYYILMPAEVSSNLARYDGVRYGYRAEAGNLQEMYLKTRHQGFGAEVQRRIMLGTFVLSAGYHDEYYKKAQQVRTLMKQDFDQAFGQVDCIIAPTSPTVAFNIGEKIDDPLTMYLADVFTVSANLAGLPAISVPCGKKGNLPIGLQIMGQHFNEALILQIAQAYEKAQ
jgi:aspartyl-tRNA(Asn)/glutamyl-tRNA(Gln) amidotransferase subunit A